MDELEEIRLWASQTLLNLGYTLTGWQDIVKTPWSYVGRLTTAQGGIYVKNVPPLLALEVSVIHLLSNHFQANVPCILAYNEKINTFLMKDAGCSLRTLLKQQFDTDLVSKALEHFSQLQIKVSSHINLFLKQGVPDWRLYHLKRLYQDILLDEAFFKKEGFIEGDIYLLRELIPTIERLCQVLSQYDIKETLVQPDFNDNNTLIDPMSQKITCIDLGEISISHPFFSLLNALTQLEKHHGVILSEARYLQIQNRALKPYEAFHSRAHLNEALKVARALWPVYSLVAYYRLSQACGPDRLATFQPGKLKHQIQNLLKAANHLD